MTTIALSNVQPVAGDGDFWVMHHDCHNDGIKIQIHAEHTPIGGPAVAQKEVTIRILDSDDNVLHEIFGSLDPLAKDDYGQSMYLPDVATRVTDGAVEIGGIEAGAEIATTSDAYGANTFTSGLLACFDEGGTTYAAADPVLSVDLNDLQDCIVSGARAAGALTVNARAMSFSAGVAMAGGGWAAWSSSGSAYWAPQLRTGDRLTSLKLRVYGDAAADFTVGVYVVTPAAALTQICPGGTTAAITNPHPTAAMLLDVRFAAWAAASAGDVRGCPRISGSLTVAAGVGSAAAGWGETLYAAPGSGNVQQTFASFTVRLPASTTPMTWLTMSGWAREAAAPMTLRMMTTVQIPPPNTLASRRRLCAPRFTNSFINISIALTP